MSKILERKFGVKQIIGESRNLTCRECGQRAGLHLVGGACPKAEITAKSIIIGGKDVKP